jgi:hypothetical protein
VTIPQPLIDIAAFLVFTAILLYTAQWLRPWNRGLNPPEALVFVAFWVVLYAVYPPAWHSIGRGFEMVVDFAFRILGFGS